MNNWKVLLVCLASAGLAVASCSHPSGTGMTGTGGSNGTGGSGNCPVGSVGCPCIGTTCDQDLSCADLGGGNTQCVTTAGDRRRAGNGRLARRPAARSERAARRRTGGSPGDRRHAPARAATALEPAVRRRPAAAQGRAATRPTT